MHDDDQTLSSLLGKYRDEAIADALGVSRQKAHRLRTGRALPPVSDLPALAELIGMELGALTSIVAAEAMRR